MSVLPGQQDSMWPTMVPSICSPLLGRTCSPEQNFPQLIFCNPFAICQYLLSVTWNITQDKPYARGISLLGPSKKVLHPGGLNNRKEICKQFSHRSGRPEVQDQGQWGGPCFL